MTVFRREGSDHRQPVDVIKSHGEKLGIETEAEGGEVLFFPDPALEGRRGNFLGWAAADDGKAVAIEGLIAAESTVREPGFRAEGAERMASNGFRHVVVGAPPSLLVAGSLGVAC